MTPSPMMKFATLCLISLSASLVLSGATDAQLTLPKLEAGQHVYTVPPNFDPPLIGKAGLTEIETAADQLHYPYFVVLVQDLPGGSDQAAANLIDGYAEAWTTRFNGIYDPLKSQIFVLTFNPRKYRFLAGSQFKQNLGFELDAHKPYTNIFVNSVSGTPKDPKSGIIKMMQAVDKYLYDHTDPERIAHRKVKTQRLYLLLGALLLVLIGAIRLKMLLNRRKSFRHAYSSWDEKLQFAYQQFAIMDAQTRDSVLILKDMEGETRALYNSVTADIDEITLSLSGLQAHLDACKAQADSAHMLNSGKIVKAEKALAEPFSYDTRQANHKDLFGSPTVVLQLNAQDFMAQLQTRYENAQAGWERLKTAAECAWHPPQEALPLELAHSFEALPAKLRIGLEHPLQSSSKAEVFYQELEALRWQDAIVYARRIAAVQQEHQRLIDDITALERNLKTITEAKTFKSQTYSQVVLAADDQPEILLERARSLHRVLDEGLESGLPFEPLRTQTKRTLEAYQAFESLEAEIGRAIDGMPDQLKRLTQSLSEHEALQSHAVEAVDEAKRYHRNADFDAALSQAQQDLQQASTDLDAVRQAEEAYRSLEAWRKAGQLEAHLATVRQALDNITAACHELAQQKQTYEETLRKMQEEADNYNNLMTGYGHPSHFSVPAYHGDDCYDYAMQLEAAQAMRQQWSDSVSAAAAAYQAEIDRQQAASSSSSSWSSSDSSSSGGSWDSGSSSSSSGGDW